MELLGYFLDALTPLNLALALVGVVLGTVIGALPGLSATMAVAVLVPFTFSMDPASGLIALGAIYTGAIYGGPSPRSWSIRPARPRRSRPPLTAIRWRGAAMAGWR